MAEALPKPPPPPFSLPCGGCKLRVRSKGRESPGHSKRFGRVVVAVNLYTTTKMQSGDINRMTLSNGRGGSYDIHSVHHWAWDGKTMYALLNDNQKVWNFNAVIKPGDRLTISYRAPKTKSKAKNRALGLVFGYDKDGPLSQNRRGPRQWWRTHSRIRYGHSHFGLRDFNVFTVNAMTNLREGTTYTNRQYMVTGPYLEMDAEARTWRGEVKQVTRFPGDVKGRAVHLFGHTPKASGKFTAFGVDLDLACGHYGEDPTCSGITTPQKGYSPMFAVRCGGLSSVTHDPYVYAPPGVGKYPYKCQDHRNKTVRPVWKLLGYFKPGQCKRLMEATFEPGFCERTSTTSSSTTSTSTTTASTSSSSTTTTSTTSSSSSATTTTISSTTASETTTSPSTSSTTGSATTTTPTPTSSSSSTISVTHTAMTVTGALDVGKVHGVSEERKGSTPANSGEHAPRCIRRPPLLRCALSATYRCCGCEPTSQQASPSNNAGSIAIARATIALLPATVPALTAIATPTVDAHVLVAESEWTLRAA